MEEYGKVIKEQILMDKFESSKDKNESLFRRWYNVYGLPFKLFNKKGKEIVMLELDPEKECELVNKLERIHEAIFKAWRDSMVYGFGIIPIYKEDIE